VLGRIAGYELLEVVGHGGMGVVFRARDSRLGSTVAVKILRDELARNEEYRERFLREARAAASLSHHAIAMCFAEGEAAIDPPDLIPSDRPGVPPAPRLYLAMEFVPGSDLSALAGGEPLAIPRVLDLAGQIAAGLEAAHAAGMQVIAVPDPALGSDRIATADVVLDSLVGLRPADLGVAGVASSSGPGA